MVRQRSSAPRSHGWDYLSDDHENRGDRPGSATRTLMFVRLPREVAEADLVQLATKYSPKSCCEDGCVESTKVAILISKPSNHRVIQVIVAYDRFGTGWTVGATWAKSPNKAGEKGTKKRANKSQKKRERKKASPTLEVPPNVFVSPSDETTPVTDMAQRLRDEAIRSLTSRHPGTQTAAHLTEVFNSMLGMPMNPLYATDFITPTSRLWSMPNQAHVGNDNAPVQPVGPLRSTYEVYAH
ncbi:hypothetical protein Pmar_PMAR008767 [Perkinsus marinus ATCC 50983]|uniref:RRM domain-containing protein n=1 Tax=Perkinsus marinus (strain ATCC 50983 / TXsc) TaxID=423536 RepID=C5L0Y5_PERM5|nr:hypothetical protein Pmar_PMAR008767 [Perkinsus marinus ATCC 50983]EER09627.1 hypothetical protein Pmar_PMAR008767 [Perkinsus marinus ATCC 50983]|eukprot:XP_002777832.1 hypothetical protein Pmar_PMAR008767 [Perkinsus marinus ATCC 50983]